MSIGIIHIMSLSSIKWYVIIFLIGEKRKRWHVIYNVMYKIQTKIKKFFYCVPNECKTLSN
jgi:hypothetical protein